MWIWRKNYETVLRKMSDEILGLRERVAAADVKVEFAERERDYFQTLFENERERADRLNDAVLAGHGLPAVSAPVRAEIRETIKQRRQEMDAMNEMFRDETDTPEFVEAAEIVKQQNEEAAAAKV